MLALLALVTSLTEARESAACAASSVAFPPACVGEPSAAAARFCFRPGDGCSGFGVVERVELPAVPFGVIGMRVESPLGPRPVTAADFPVLLAPLESLVADLTVTLASPGDVQGLLTWFVREGSGGTSDGDDGDDGPDGCPVTLQAAAPGCVDDACSTGAVCVAGVCIAGTPIVCADTDPCTADGCDPITGCTHVPKSEEACDDGDACTVEDRCTEGRCAGRPRSCPDDAIACTEERCIAGACQHLPVDGRCGADTCAIGACVPGDPAADGRGCVAITEVAEGQPCADDAVACTDDVCTAGGCLHIPIDSRCAAPEVCRQAVCAPERPDRDAQGCAIPEGTSGDEAVCGEDGDPCSEDVCRAGACAHDPIAEHAQCAPLAPAFRRALGLAASARALREHVNGMAGQPHMSAAVAGALTDPLHRADTDLTAAVRALAGKLLPAPSSDRLARERARMAFLQVRQTPRAVGGFVKAVGHAETDAAMDDDTAGDLRRRGRLLRRGVRALKAELKRLKGVSQTFAREAPSGL